MKRTRTNDRLPRKLSALHRVSGAQTPSGIPVVITAPAAEHPEKRGATSRGRRRPASAARRASVRQSNVSTTA